MRPTPDVEIFRNFLVDGYYHYLNEKMNSALNRIIDASEKLAKDTFNVEELNRLNEAKRTFTTTKKEIETLFRYEDLEKDYITLILKELIKDA